MANIDFTDSIYDAQQGSQSAIRFIYDNTIQLFYKEANAFLRDKQAADIAIRDAYIFIFEHLSSLEDASKFLLWANEVCKNTCISMLCDAGVFDERIPAEAVNLGEIASASDYDAQINMSANMSPDYVQECLEAVLSSLPDNQRACAILWGEGYPVRSISRKLGISPVAVNYTLAYTLGNITNSVNALSANGLPLFAMEPIPYFLWLLMCYYQYYQPGDLVPGAECSFSNILRVLMPGEASVYSGEFSGPEYYSDGRVKLVTRRRTETSSAAATSAGYTGDDLDISAFIHEGPDAADTKAAVPEQPEAEEIPEMAVYAPHDNEDSLADPESEDSSATDVSADGKEKTDADDAGGSSDGASHPDAPAGSGETDTGSGEKEASVPETSGQSDSEAVLVRSASDSQDDESAAKVNDSAVDDILFGSSSMKTASEAKPPKKHTGLIIFLIVIIIILCLLIAFMFLFKKQVNEILGINLFNITQLADPQSSEEPVAEAPSTDEPITEEITTPEPTTEAPTTEEPTTEEPTTEEPTTEEPTTEADPGPEFDVVIYLGDNALAMHATPNNDEQRLLYIPAGQQVHIDSTENGWGHTYYEDQEGWIWLYYTRIVGNARVMQPEEGTMLAEPQSYTIGLTEDNNELRTMPDISSTFGPIPEGTEIQIEAYYEDTWNHYMYGYTSYDGHHGWVYLYSTAQTEPEL